MNPESGPAGGSAMETATPFFTVPAGPTADKPFVYLVQAASRMPYDDLPDGCNDIILLTWKTPAGGDSVFFPCSSWNEGRNRLLQEALQRVRESGRPYRYYIFLDEDCEVAEDVPLARRLKVPLTGNPFRTFESCLLEWEPALGYTRYAWQHYEPGRETNLGHNLDALFNAFHCEAVAMLLPYYTGFDGESWLYSQNIINHLATLLYHPYRMQFNVITTRNRQRNGYVQRGRNWAAPTEFLRQALRRELRDLLNVAHPNTIFPPPGRPLKKDRSYAISQAFVERNFDLCHPYLRQKAKFYQHQPVRCAGR